MAMSCFFISSTRSWHAARWTDAASRVWGTFPVIPAIWNREDQPHPTLHSAIIHVKSDLHVMGVSTYSICQATLFGRCIVSSKANIRVTTEELRTSKIYPGLVGDFDNAQRRPA